MCCQCLLYKAVVLAILLYGAEQWRLASYIAGKFFNIVVWDVSWELPTPASTGKNGISYILEDIQSYG